MKWTKTKLGNYTAEGDMFDFAIQKGTGKSFGLPGTSPSAPVWKLQVFGFGVGPGSYYLSSLKAAQEWAESTDRTKRTR
jgi:hypothetical protein